MPSSDRPSEKQDGASPETSEAPSTMPPQKPEESAELHPVDDLEELIGNMRGNVSASIQPSTEPPVSSDEPFFFSSQHPPTKKASIQIVEEVLKKLKPKHEEKTETKEDPDPDPEAA